MSAPNESITGVLADIYEAGWAVECGICAADETMTDPFREEYESVDDAISQTIEHLDEEHGVRACSGVWSETLSCSECGQIFDAPISPRRGGYYVPVHVAQG